MEPDITLFDYDHLPPHLQEASKPFHVLAWSIFGSMPSSTERGVCLRHLLDAKDAAVRCAVSVHKFKQMMGDADDTHVVKPGSPAAAERDPFADIEEGFRWTEDGRQVPDMRMKREDALNDTLAEAVTVTLTEDGGGKIYTVSLNVKADIMLPHDVVHDPDGRALPMLTDLLCERIGLDMLEVGEIATHKLSEVSGIPYAPKG